MPQGLPDHSGKLWGSERLLLDRELSCLSYQTFCLTLQRKSSSWPSGKPKANTLDSQEALSGEQLHTPSSIASLYPTPGTQEALKGRTAKALNSPAQVQNTGVCFQAEALCLQDPFLQRPCPQTANQNPGPSSQEPCGRLGRQSHPGGRRCVYRLGLTQRTLIRC